MIKRIVAIVLKLQFVFLAQFAVCALAQTEYEDEIQAVLVGKGVAKCEDDLPTLSVASENTINSKAEWDEFVAKNPFFLVGAADSSCRQCCDSEPLLRDALMAIKNKNMFSFPEKNKKQKKIVRREIQLARIDLANKALVEKLAAQGIWFPMGTTIYIGNEGRVYKYDGMFANVNMLLHQMQRVASPLINLSSEEQIMKFLDNETPAIWEEDYSGPLLPKGQTFDDEQLMDNFAREIGFNTRVVAFYYDKKEYAEEIKILRHSAMALSNRYNIRIGLVTDDKLVTRMKKTHGELFNDVGMSVMVLKRYDGAIFKLNVADVQPARYLWWMTVKSTKAVDHLSPGAYQVTETAHMPMVTIFTDFSDPRVADKSADLIKTLEELAPLFEERFKFFWTDDQVQLDQRRILGITWDELPAIGLNSLEHVVFAYPQYEPFEKEKLTKWLHEISMKKTAETELRSKDFIKRQRDPTIFQYFLDKTIAADRDTFDNVILREDADSVMFIYSTENVNYVQRKACFQFNLVIETLSSEALYGEAIGDKIKFYSYDAYQHAFPKGIPYLKSPPQDTVGNQIVSEEQRKSGVPAIYIFPAGQKSLPYVRMMAFPMAEEIIDFILDKQTTGLRVKPEQYKGLGKRSIDEQAFHRRIDKEGVIQLSTAFDEL